MIGVAAAIANAVYDAVGVRIKNADHPRVPQALRSNKNRKGDKHGAGIC